MKSFSLRWLIERPVRPAGTVETIGGRMLRNYSCVQQKEARYRFVLVKLFFIFILAFSRVAGGQTSSGRMVGTVADSTGAVVPYATVSVTNVSTGYSRKVETGGAGEYVLDALPIGAYTVQVKAAGFQSSQRTGWAQPAWRGTLAATAW